MVGQMTLWDFISPDPDNEVVDESKSQGLNLAKKQ